MIPSSFLRVSLPRGGKFGDGPGGGSLGRLAAGVGVDLRIENQQVNIGAGCQHVIYAPEADIVSPAVPADDPD